MTAVAVSTVCIAILLLTVSAQIDVSLFSDEQCTMPLSASALLFNSVQAWSSLASSQLVPAFQSLTSDSFPPVSNLTNRSCQSTTSLQQAGVGVGLYSCAPPTNGVDSSNGTIVYSGVIALAEWPTATASSCPAQLATAPQQVVLYYLVPGNGSAYACALGYLTTSDSTPTAIYAIVNKACRPTSNHAGHVVHGWSLYCMLLLLVVAFVSQELCGGVY